MADLEQIGDEDGDDILEGVREGFLDENPAPVTKEAQKLQKLLQMRRELMKKLRDRKNKKLLQKQGVRKMLEGAKLKGKKVKVKKIPKNIQDIIASDDFKRV